MKYDYSKLKGRITELFGSQKCFAKALGKDDAYVSKYLNGGLMFSQRAINIWCQALQIQYTDIGEYFFKKKVDK